MIHPKYRPDIDGLRAVAVLSVLCFHAFPEWLPGGFTGVDIFFVISGFLITTIILRNVSTGQFSYRDFYARRIKRIFPALVLVLAATLVFGWYVLLSNEFAELGKQVVGGAAFIANFIFWGESGYFDTAAETKPLLHLWSLGIEEQFYIFWPLLLGFAARRRWPMVRVIVCIGIVSFLVNVLTVHPYRAASFYSPASRFWELMVGGVLACLHLRDTVSKPLKAQLQSVAGIALIVLALIFIKSTKAFPGWWALLPTFGAALCIAAGPAAIFNRYLLSNRVLVSIGLISYPLYLWHWPLLVYARIVEDGTPSMAIRAAALLASLVLAWLTYRFVERHTRKNTRSIVIPSLVAPAVLMALVGLVALGGFVLPRNDSAKLQQIADASLDRNFYAGLKGIYLDGQYVYTTGSGRDKVLLLGDSHVEQYAARALELAREDPTGTRTAYFATMGACPPIPGVSDDRNAQCAERRSKLLKFAASSDIDTIVIGGCWNCYFTGGGAPHYFFRDSAQVMHPFHGGDGAELALGSLESLLKELARHKKVYFLLDNPVGEPFEPKRLMVGSRLHELHALEESPAVQVPEEERQLNRRLNEIGARSGVTVIDPFLSLCKAGQCLRTMPDGTPAYHDAGHLRPTFTRKFASYVDIALREPGAPVVGSKPPPPPN